MANYKEIVTKAVVSKGKKEYITNHEIHDIKASTILGCWVINHKYNGVWNGNDIIIDGEYDVNIWYSSDNNTNTEVYKEKNKYHEVVHMRNTDDIDGNEIIVRSLSQPTCTNININDNTIFYTIEKVLGIELVGDIKVKIEANDDDDDEWDEIIEDNIDNGNVDTDIDKVDENFIEDVI